MPTLNTGLLRQVVEHAEWDGLGVEAIAVKFVTHGGLEVVKYGVEGHAIAIEYPGALWHWEQHPDYEADRYATLVTVDGSLKKPGRNAAHVARKLLGLDAAQAERLFSVADLGELQRVAAELIELAEAGAS